MTPKSRIATAVIAAAVLLAPAAPASAAPAPCGTVVTTPGTVISLTADLHCDRVGITVRADNVSIELNGFAIHGYPGTGDVSAGVVVDSARNTRIAGGDIAGFTNGIVVRGSTLTQVHDLGIHETTGDGVLLRDSRGIHLEDVRVTGQGRDAWPMRGVVANNVEGLTAVGLEVTDFSDHGVLIENSATVTLAHSTVLRNGGEGIALWHTAGAIKLDSVVSSQNWRGIVIAHSSSAHISRSTTSDNEELGLHTINATNTRITDHTANGNGGQGIWMTSGRDATYGHLIPYTATIESSTANRNGHGGIALSDVGRWTVIGNTATSNAHSGFGIFGGTATLSGNTSAGNGHHGYAWDWDAHGTSTRDVATGNARNGVLVDNRSSDKRVWLTDVTATGNTQNGVQLVSGVVNVTRGSYSNNKVEGIQGSSGSLFVKDASALKNGRNGIAYLGNAVGSIEMVNSSKNGRYGICIAKRPFGWVFDVPPHELLNNGLGPRGSNCTQLIIVLPPTWPYLPTPGLGATPTLAGAPLPS